MSEAPGQFPYTRGIYPDMYRSRLWTMRQYAGFGTAEESNRRYRYLLSQGITGLSVAFDLPTQMGMDSDHPLAAGEVGRVGVAICSLADMERLFEGHPARRGHHVDDHQFDGGDSVALLRAGRAPPGRGCAQAIGHHSERHPEGIHRARHLYLSAEAGDADHHRSVRVGGRGDAASGTPSRSAGITFAKRDRRRCRRWRSRWPTPSPISKRRFAPDWTWMRSHRGCRSSSTRITIFWRRSPSIAPRGGSTPTSCGIASARRIRAR